MQSKNIRILREPEVHAMTGLSQTTRWRLEKAGQFPKKNQVIRQCCWLGRTSH